MNKDTRKLLASIGEKSSKLDTESSSIQLQFTEIEAGLIDARFKVETWTSMGDHYDIGFAQLAGGWRLAYRWNPPTCSIDAKNVLVPHVLCHAPIDIQRDAVKYLSRLLEHIDQELGRLLKERKRK